MRTSELFGPPTAKCQLDGVPDDLLEEAGYVHRLTDGVYSLLPLGLRVVQRITAIVRQAVESAGGQEVAMALLQPLEIWHATTVNGSTRAEALREQLFHLTPRGDRLLILAPTHEEVAATLAAQGFAEGRSLPLTLFQIQPRFRDHDEFGGGLLRTREFLMMDAYSFDTEPSGLDDRYDQMRHLLRTAVLACGARADWADADAGAMGGELSEELIAPLPTVVYPAAWRCPGCGKAESADVAAFARRQTAVHPAGPARMVEAPDGLSKEALAAWLGSSIERGLTWIPFVASGRVIVAVIPADLTVHPPKLARALAASGVACHDLHVADAAELRAMGLNFNDVCPLGAGATVLVVGDEAIYHRRSLHAPSPLPGWAADCLEPGRDLRLDVVGDIARVESGAVCSRCGSVLDPVLGIEVAHIFKLGAHFSVAFGARASGHPVQMGSYGLGITRLLSVVAAQNRDERGLVWPTAIAPYRAVITPLADEHAAREAAEQQYRDLRALGVDALLDDAAGPLTQRAAAVDRLGIPFIVGVRAIGERPYVELRERASGQVHHIAASTLPTVLA